MQVTITKPKNVQGKAAQLDAAEFARIMEDPVYFIDNYCYTFDTRNAPYHFPFKLYDFQKDYVRWVVRHIEEEKNGLTEKSRDMGVSWCVLAVALWYWLFKPGSDILLGSRTEEFVDDFTVISLFGKIDYMLERLPFTPEGYDKNKHRNRLKLINPMNGNIIKGESANANFSRQGRYKFIIPDEFAFWEYADTAWSAMGESSPCLLPVTTPPHKPHFVKGLRLSGLIEVNTLHWRLHPKKDDVWYEAQKERKSLEEIARELDINWEGSITGLVYPEVNHVRIGDFGYMPHWPLFVSHDPGHDPDPHALQWYQVNPDTGRYRLLESYEKKAGVVDWFLPLFGFPVSSGFTYTAEELKLIEKVTEWKKATHFGDQAGRIRNQVSGSSVYQELQKHGIYVNSNTKANDLDSRKSYARRILMNLDVNDTPQNRYFMECVKNARYPDLNVSSQRVTVNDKPIHDWTSHHRSALEYFAVNVEYSKVDPDVPGLTFQKVMVRMKNKKNLSFIGNE